MAPPLSPSRRRPTARQTGIKPAAGLRKTRPETVPMRGSVPSGRRFLRVPVWAALATGPLALAVALAAPSTTVVQAAPHDRTAAVVRPPADPAGTAEVFVDLWLRADASTPDSPASVAVRALAADAELPKRPRAAKTAAAPDAYRVMSVRTSYGAAGWTVVVAAISEQPGPDGAAAGPAVRYYAVSGIGGEDGGPVRVTGAPGEVSAPTAALVVHEAVLHPAPSGGVLATSLAEFMRAYLGGSQGAGVERYLSPGITIPAPTGAAYTRVEVEDVTADDEAAVAKVVPADGARARVRVRVVGQDAARVRWPLEYRLEVTARAGRWEVSELDAATTTSPPPSAGTTGSAAVAGGAR
ncbi:conjugal transfer protein [Streptomyces sp. NPDC002073]